MSPASSSRPVTFGPPRLCLVRAMAAIVLAALTTGAAGAAPKTPDVSGLPQPSQATAPDILLRADALVRGGHLPEARILLNQVIEQFPNTPWAGWGELGLGFLQLARGRMVEARPYYDAAAAGGFRDTASVVLALLDAQDGKTTQAVAVLDALAHDPSRNSSVREAAGLGAGYVRYWAGDYGGAALAFAAAADRHPGGSLADDALYGLAQSFVQLGDPVTAEQVLERTSEMPAAGFDDAHVRPALRKLSLREILRATRKRYDSVPVGQPDQMLVALLDVNGRALANRSLAALAEHEERTTAGTSAGDAARSAAAALARRRNADAVPATVSRDAPALRSDASATEVARRAGEAPPAARHRTSGGRVRGLTVLALLGTLVALVGLRLRAASGTVARGARAG
jgi:tetratricopeptide (TPR) repeat protein